MINVINWFIEHKEDIAATYGCLVALCTAIIKLFPSNKSNSAWGTIIKGLDYFSTAFADSDKNKIESKK